MKYLSIVFILSIDFFYTSCDKEDDPIPTDFIGTWEYETLRDTSYYGNSSVFLKTRRFIIFTQNSYEEKLQNFDESKNIYVDMEIYKGDLTYSDNGILNIFFSSISYRLQSLTGEFTDAFITYKEGTAEFNYELEFITGGVSQITFQYSMINEDKMSLKQDVNFDGQINEQDYYPPTVFIRAN